MKTPFFKMVVLLFVCLSLAACATQLKQLPNGEFSTRVDGVKVHYAVHGKGPVCMTLTNAWGLTYQGLRALYRPLEEHMTMVYFDPRGMGKSDPIRVPEDMSMQTVRKDLEALRRHLKLGKVIVMGWSNGAMNLIKYAAEYPDSIAKGILLHGVAYKDPADQEKFAQKYPELVQDFMKFFGRMTQSRDSDDQKNIEMKNFIINKWFPHLMKGEMAASQKLEKLYERTSFSVKHMYYSITADRGFDARKDLGKIKCPFLVVSGEEDLIPAEKIRKVHEAIPGSIYVNFKSSGHFSPIEEPKLFVKTILDFVKK